MTSKVSKHVLCCINIGAQVTVSLHLAHIATDCQLEIRNQFI